MGKVPAKGRTGRPTGTDKTAKKLESSGISPSSGFRFKNLLEACAADEDGSKLLRAAIARGVGLTIPKAAEFAGVSERTVNYWGQEPGFVSVVAWVARAVEGQATLLEKVSVDSYKTELEDCLTDCKSVLRQALKSDDLNLALRAVKQLEDRLFGSPTQNIKQTSFGVKVDVTRLPEAALRAFFSTSDELTALRSLPPAVEATEAEVVEAEDEAIP